MIHQIFPNIVSQHVAALHIIALFSDKHKRNIFLEVEQKYFNGGLVEHWTVTSEFMEDVMKTSGEKKAPSWMEWLQKGYCREHLGPEIQNKSICEKFPSNPVFLDHPLLIYGKTMACL